MDANGFRRIVLGMDGATEGAHMQHPDFRAKGRIFATLHADAKHGVVKLTPEQQTAFVTEHPAAFVPESGAWGRQGYTRVLLAAAEDEVVGEAVTLAWQNVQGHGSQAAKRTRPTTGRRKTTRQVIRHRRGGTTTAKPRR